MADTHAPINAAPPVTEESLLAQRQGFWRGFNNATMIAIVVVAVIVILVLLQIS